METMDKFSMGLIMFVLIGGFIAAQANHWAEIKERSEFNRFVDKVEADYKMTPFAEKHFTKVKASIRKDNLMTDAERAKAYKQLFAGN
jgi:hypothetical protein